MIDSFPFGWGQILEFCGGGQNANGGLALLCLITVYIETSGLPLTNLFSLDYMVSLLFKCTGHQSHVFLGTFETYPGLDSKQSNL